MTNTNDPEKTNAFAFALFLLERHGFGTPWHSLLGSWIVSQKRRFFEVLAFNVADTLEIDTCFTYLTQISSFSLSALSLDIHVDLMKFRRQRGDQWFPFRPRGLPTYYLGNIYSIPQYKGPEGMLTTAPDFPSSSLPAAFSFLSFFLLFALRSTLFVHSEQRSISLILHPWAYSTQQESFVSPFTSITNFA